MPLKVNNYNFDDRETLICGDIHGTYDEFNLLIKNIKYNKNKHRLVLVGDVLDRGVDPIGLMHQIQDMQLEMVLGNHEEKAYRWRKHDSIEKLTGKKNPMKEPVPSRKREWLSMTNTDLVWITGLPHIIQVKNDWIVVHGGLEACYDLKDQCPDRVIRVRYLDSKTGKHVPGKDIKEIPKGSVFWAEKWDKPYNVVFGHSRFDKPQIFKNKNNVCIGVDTSAVYGGALTAYSIDKNEFISVPAAKKYYP